MTSDNPTKIHRKRLTRQRLDSLLVERGMCPSRHKAQALILAGKIWVNGKPVYKAGCQVKPDINIELQRPEHDYVSRGGLKLAKALNYFGVDARGLTCIDVGASTGGYTDCLLQNGALKIFAVDVGYGQLAWKLRQNPRVVVIEKTNIRHLPANAIPEPVDLAVIDVSFISLKIVVPATMKFLKPKGRLIVLIKPQFEVGKGQVGKGGIVKDPILHQQVIMDLNTYFTNLNMQVSEAILSPITGAKGNREYLMLLGRDPTGRTN